MFGYFLTLEIIKKNINKLKISGQLVKINYISLNLARENCLLSSDYQYNKI